MNHLQVEDIMLESKRIQKQMRTKVTDTYQSG